MMPSGRPQNSGQAVYNNKKLMPAIGGKRKGKGFTSMTKNCILIFLMFVGFTWILGCKTDVPDNPIPYVLVYEELNLNDLRIQELQQPNGYIYLDDAGYKGVIVHSDGSGNYRAYDRACPYHPQDPCALVSMHSSGFYLEEDCCGSTFDLSGVPTAGPAQSFLRQYNTFIDGNYLIISSN